MPYIALQYALRDLEIRWITLHMVDLLEPQRRACWELRQSPLRWGFWGSLAGKLVKGLRNSRGIPFCQYYDIIWYNMIKIYHNLYLFHVDILSALERWRTHVTYSMQMSALPHPMTTHNRVAKTCTTLYYCTTHSFPGRKTNDMLSLGQGKESMETHT